MKKFRLLAIVALLLSILIVSSVSQTEPGAYVAPSMIEISYDGEIFGDASALVSDIQIVVGQVTETHVNHAKRGDIITWKGQLGTPEEDKYATWKINTGVIPATENRFYVRFKFAVVYNDGTSDESPFSDQSDIVKLTGKPKKPVNRGVVESM